MATTTTSAPKAPKSASAKWRGPMREYDVVKEFVAALAVVALLTAILAAVFSSPDEKGLTLQSWAQGKPNDFAATAAAELAGTSGSATYGPPYNSADEGQKIGPLKLAKWAGVRVPIDPPNDFVIGPLSALPPSPDLTAALALWKAAPPDQQTKWATAYADALAAAPDGDPTKVADGDYGPVPKLTTSLLEMATTGALDSQLVDESTGFFQTDYTRPMLFLADGTFLEDAANGQHLTGEQWGMMNETGSYPGQAWLWLYTFWYQVPPFTTSWEPNADALIWGLMMLLSLVLALVPFIPGVRSIPRWVPVYKLVWRDYYRAHPRS